MKLSLPKEKYVLVGAILSLLLVCLPRFNGNQTWVQQVPWDAQYFNAYVSYFRGEIVDTPIRPMSNSRFLLPFIASVLPFSASTALNLVNLFCAAGSLLCLYYILKHIGAEPKQRWWAVFIAIFSFPSFYYTCISYVDPGAIFFVSLGVYAWLKKWYWTYFLAVLLGLMTKETSIVLLPFAMAWSFQHRAYRSLLFVGFGLILFFFLHYLIQLYAPLTPGEIRFKPWQFNWGAAQNNLNRPHTLLSLVFSLGIPALLLLRGFLKNDIILFKNAETAAAFGALLAVFALYLFSFVTTVADGRIIWHGYVFMFMLIFKKQSSKN
jgi:hypothetical protein